MLKFNKTYLLNGIFSRNQTDLKSQVQSKYLQALPLKEINKKSQAKSDFELNINNIRSMSTNTTLKSNISYDNHSSNSLKFQQLDEEISHQRLSSSQYSTPSNKVNPHRQLVKKSLVNFSNAMKTENDESQQLPKIYPDNDIKQIINQNLSEQTGIPKIQVIPPKNRLYQFESNGSLSCPNALKDKRRVSYDLKLIQQHQLLNVKSYEYYSENYENSLDSLEEQDYENEELNDQKNKENTTKSLQPSPNATYVGGFVIKKESRRYSFNNKEQLLNQTTSIFKQLRRNQKKSKFQPSLNNEQDKKNVLDQSKQTENIQQNVLSFNNVIQKTDILEKEVQDKNFCQICDKKINYLGILNCCSHKFCFQCISIWNVNQHCCPICFKLFKSIQKLDLNDPQFATKQNLNSIVKFSKYLIQQDLANSKFFQCTNCKSKCCTAFSTKYIYSNEKIICQSCYQNDHKKCQKCKMVFQQKLKKFQGLKFCSRCHEDMINLYCTVCQTMLNEENMYEKPWKNKEKICKTCKMNKFCYYCEENISKMSYCKLSIGHVCLNCKMKRYCAICKQSVCQHHEKPIEGQHFVYKQHLQNKNYVYCVHCEKTQFCKACDQILKFNKQFKLSSKSEDLVCEECYRADQRKKSYLKYFKLI